MYRIEQIISLLSYFKSAPVKAWSKGERVAKKFHVWFLVLAVSSFIICLVLAGIHHYSPLSQSTKTVALILALLTHFFGMLLLLPDIIIGLVTLVTLVMWRRHMLVSFIREIAKDEKNTLRLMEFNESELQYAKYLIEMKIARNESRLKLFFGDKTAALALLGLLWSRVKEPGGLAWISTSFNHFLTPANILDTVIWRLCLVLLLRLTLGGMMKNVNERYKYQVSLIDLRSKHMRE